jgi:hypothetical protein
VRRIAEETLQAIERGSTTYSLADAADTDTDVNHECVYDLSAAIDASIAGTIFYAADSDVLSSWSDISSTSRGDEYTPTKVKILELSTIEGARMFFEILPSSSPDERIGVLNFASAKSVSLF